MCLISCSNGLYDKNAYDLHVVYFAKGCRAFVENMKEKEHKYRSTESIRHYEYRIIKIPSWVLGSLTLVNEK